MLDHLHIENFLTFEKLEINQLKRVNLIAGKNNSGKTSLLEAIKLIKADRKGDILNDILFRFGLDNFSKSDLPHSIFNRQILATFDFPIIIINEFEIVKGKSRNKMRIQSAGTHLWELSLWGDIDDSYSDVPKPLSTIKTEEFDCKPRYYNSDENFIYVPFYSDFNTLDNLWEDIVLTPKEDDVLKILQDAIEPDIIRFDVGREKVRVRIKGVEKPVSLKTFGDGVQRILLIALSLANAQGKTLLIDEIELGLHYSVLEKLWEMIFKYSQLWNIQVFVTTHSKDAINAFHYISSQKKYIDDAEFIRLQKNRKGESEAIIYDGEKLAEVLDLSLEIR